MIWYLFDNAKYFSSHVCYNHKISCISEEIENVQKWTFSIAISISPKSIIALKRLTLLAFRKSSNVISAFCIIPLSNSAALFVPGNKGCLGVTLCLPSNMAYFTFFLCVGCSRFSKYFLFHFCLIFNDVIDCVLTLISQSENYLVILQDESRIWMHSPDKEAYISQ